MYNKQENRCSHREADGDAVQDHQGHKHRVVYALQIKRYQIHNTSPNWQTADDLDQRAHQGDLPTNAPFGWTQISTTNNLQQIRTGVRANGF